MVASQQLLTKVYFPRLLLPLASVSVSLVDFALSFVVLGGEHLWSGDSLRVTVRQAAGEVDVPGVKVVVAHNRYREAIPSGENVIVDTEIAQLTAEAARPQTSWRPSPLTSPTRSVAGSQRRASESSAS